MCVCTCFCVLCVYSRAHVHVNLEIYSELVSNMCVWACMCVLVLVCKMRATLFCLLVHDMQFVRLNKLNLIMGFWKYLCDTLLRSCVQTRFFSLFQLVCVFVNLKQSKLVHSGIYAYQKPHTKKPFRFDSRS